MKTTDLLGEYAIVGSNQNSEKTTYKGILTLKEENNVIIAHWLINNEQEQFGTGFFKNNILVINFHYFGEDNLVYKGTVVYQYITKDLLEGFWSEEHGNPQYLGKEQAIRLTTTETLH